MKPTDSEIQRWATRKGPDDVERLAEECGRARSAEVSALIRAEEAEKACLDAQALLDKLAAPEAPPKSTLVTPFALGMEVRCQLARITERRLRIEAEQRAVQQVAEFVSRSEDDVAVLRQRAEEAERELKEALERAEEAESQVANVHRSRARLRETLNEVMELVVPGADKHLTVADTPERAREKRLELVRQGLENIERRVKADMEQLVTNAHARADEALCDLAKVRSDMEALRRCRDELDARLQESRHQFDMALKVLAGCRS